MATVGDDDVTLPFGALPWPALLATGGTVVSASASAIALLGGEPVGETLAVALERAAAAGIDPTTTELDDARVLVALHDRGPARHLAALVDAIADSTFTLDATGGLLWRSARLVERAGELDAVTIADRSPVERIHPEDMPILLESFSSILAEPGRRTRIEVRSRSVVDDDVFELIEIIGTNRLDDPDIGGIVVQVHNLGEGRRVLDLARDEGDLHSLADAVPVGILLGDPSGRVVYRNSSAKAILGDGILSLTQEGWLELIRPEHRHGLRELVDLARTGRGGGEMTLAFHRAGPAAAQSGIGWVRLRLAPLLGLDGGSSGVVATIEDVTQQMEARAETERLTQMLDASSDFVVVWRVTTGETLWANAVTRAMLEIPLSDGSPRRLTHLLDRSVRERFAAETAAILESSDVWHGELTLRHPRRGPVPVSATGVVQRADDGSIDTVALVARDISELKAAEERLRHLANHDPLTGLPNRSLLTDHLDDAIARHRRGSEGLAVVFCDLDGFKEVNDRLGHVVGDVVLTEVARRLAVATRDVDLVARVGGDEFVVVCEEVSLAEIEEIADRLVAAVAPPILAGGETVLLSCSAGVAYVEPGEVADPDRLLLVADRVMYEAKAAGRARHAVEVVGARRPPAPS